MDLLEAGLTNQIRHPWEKARFKFFSKVLEPTIKDFDSLKILDMGAGDAWFASRLLDALPSETSVHCVDSNYDENSQVRLNPTSLHNLHIESSTSEENFSHILLLDVIEHIEDDELFLREVVESFLSPNGYVLISVPAWNLLFTQHDRYLKHFRRYSPASCKRVIHGAGLKIVTSGGLFHSLLIVRTVEKILESIGCYRQGDAKGAGAWEGGAYLTSAVDCFLHLDNSLSIGLSKLGINLPGLSWWALCRKQ